MTSNITQSLKDVLKNKFSLRDAEIKLFISKYHDLFNIYLAKMDGSTKQIIRTNKELNELYDLFLDFILDSAQLLKNNRENNESIDWF